MAIPTFDQLMRPVLELASKQDINRHVATDAMMEEFQLTPEEREVRIKSGSLTIRNRTGWAMSHLNKGKLIEKVAKATYRITDKGRNLLADHDGPLTIPIMRAKVPGFQEAWDSAKKKKAEQRAQKEAEEDSTEDDSSTTPDEAMDKALKELDESLREEVLEQLYEINPYRFEQVVIDVLLAMGYGGSRDEAAQVTQKSNDGGIDGIINEDRLGLDVIYVQAKRYKEENTIGRKEIQSFVGALAGKQANKGVFITTSDFKGTAVEYAQNVPQRVILINGDRLSELMIEHDVGVSAERVIRVKRIDSDYFEES